MKLLHIDSSALGQYSVTRELTAAAVAQYRDREANLDVTYRDLAADPLPHWAPLGNDPAALSPELQTQAQTNEAVMQEFLAADVLVIGAPMYNFGVTTGLRSWFDYVLRAGETFSYSSAGPKGLLAGKRVIVIESRGGLYSEGPASAVDFQEPYLRHLLGFIGLTDVTFVHAEKIGYGPEARDASIRQAKLDIAALAEALPEAA